MSQTQVQQKKAYVQQPMSKKPNDKYYVRTSWNHPEWFAVCQASNNVVIADCAEKEFAELICDLLNQIPRRLLPYSYAQKRPKGDKGKSETTED